MKKIFGAVVALWCAAACWAQGLPRTSPDAQGVPSAKVMELLDSLMSVPQAELHSVTLLRHGNIIAEAAVAPVRYDYQHELFSVSKTFTGAAVGLAVADNLLRLDDRLGAILPEELPDSVSEWLADVTVRDLLTMTSGMPVDWTMRSKYDHWVREFMSRPMAHEPGSRFAYDSMSTYLLSALVQKVTGRRMLDYLQERIFTPLGISDYAWDFSPDGVTVGGWGLWMKPEHIARFGQLLLDGGKWQGKQLLPQEWVREMTSRQMPLNGKSDYGYQTWTCPHYGASRADGAWGQFIIMMPQEDMVAVITECQQGVGEKMMGYVWDILSPALSDEALPQGKDYGKLQKKIGALSHAFPAGKADGKALKLLQGRTLLLPHNPMEWKELTIVKTKGAGELSLVAVNDKGASEKIPCGWRTWQLSTLTGTPPDDLSTIHNRLSGHSNEWLASAAYGCTPASGSNAAEAPFGAVNIRIFYPNWYSAVKLTIAPAQEGCAVTFHLNYGKPVTVNARWKE